MHNHHNHFVTHVHTVKYCERCDVCYCTGCLMEWKSHSTSYTVSTPVSWTLENPGMFWQNGNVVADNHAH